MQTSSSPKQCVNSTCTNIMYVPRYKLHMQLQCDECCEGRYICYQCNERTNWLAPDSRCIECTHLTPEEVRGES